MSPGSSGGGLGGHPVPGVPGRNLVGLGERWIVEGVFDEAFEPAADLGAPRACLARDLDLVRIDKARLAAQVVGRNRRAGGQIKGAVSSGLRLLWRNRVPY